MTLTPEQEMELILCGRFNFPLSKIIVKLDIPIKEVSFFEIEFKNQHSELRRKYEKGKIASEFEIMETLENNISVGGENADESAKALNSIRRSQTYNDLLKKYYNI